MDIGDNFMIMLSNQEVQVAFGKSCILYPMRDKINMSKCSHFSRATWSLCVSYEGRGNTPSFFAFYPQL